MPNIGWGSKAALSYSASRKPNDVRLAPDDSAREMRLERESARMLTGGCLCGAVRFEARGDVRMRGLCYCKTCQKVSGGAGNLFIGLMADGFGYTKGGPSRFTMAPDAPTREFCPTCGVQIAARSPRAPEGVIVKVGALDDPSIFEGPSIVVWTEEKEAFHPVPEGVAAFARVPSPPKVS